MKSTINPKNLKKGQALLRIGQRGVSNAQELNRQLGIPNTYSINGSLYYELPNGDLSPYDPKHYPPHAWPFPAGDSTA
jgi:hypothetical protein